MINTIFNSGDTTNPETIGSETTITIDREKFFKLFKEVRRQTIELVETLEIEDFVVQTDVFMSPPRWHLGHVSWFFEQLLKKYYKNYKPFKQDFSYYLNSYYQVFGKPFNKVRRGTISRPTINEITDYWRHINMQFSEFIHNSVLTDEIIGDCKIGFNHEWQHQELLIYDLQHLLQDKYKPKNKKVPLLTL